MSNQFDTDDIRLTPAASRLAKIYFRRMAGQGRQSDLAGERIWYAAASAAECLQLAHEDAGVLRRDGGARKDADKIRMMGRIDSRFYVDLAQNWMQQAHLTA